MKKPAVASLHSLLSVGQTNTYYLLHLDRTEPTKETSTSIVMVYFFAVSALSFPNHYYCEVYSNYTPVIRALPNVASEPGSLFGGRAFPHNSPSMFINALCVLNPSDKM